MMNNIKLTDYELEIIRRALSQIIDDDINHGELSIRELGTMNKMLAKIDHALAGVDD